MKGSHPSKSSGDIEAAKGETGEIAEHYSTAYSKSASNSTQRAPFFHDSAAKASLNQISPISCLTDMLTLHRQSGTAEVTGPSRPSRAINQGPRHDMIPP